ncbi:MAG: hypothetical protein V5A66_00955 [Candidatus Thermoplasmatota archaeon]
MTLLKDLKEFFKGALDYDNPSAGCGCGGIGADPTARTSYLKKKRESPIDEHF